MGAVGQGAPNSQGGGPGFCTRSLSSVWLLPPPPPTGLGTGWEWGESMDSADTCWDPTHLPRDQGREKEPGLLSVFCPEDNRRLQQGCPGGGEGCVEPIPTEAGGRSQPPQPHFFLCPPRAEFRWLLCTRQHMDSSTQPHIHPALQERLGGGGGEADMEGVPPGCGTQTR